MEDDKPIYTARRSRYVTLGNLTMMGAILSGRIPGIRRIEGTAVLVPRWAQVQPDEPLRASQRSLCPQPQHTNDKQYIGATGGSCPYPCGSSSTSLACKCVDSSALRSRPASQTARTQTGRSKYRSSGGRPLTGVLPIGLV